MVRGKFGGKLTSVSCRRPRTRQSLLAMHREVIDFASRCSFRWRELAFSERDKLNRQLDESRKACDKLTDERENLFKQLEEVVKVGLSFEMQLV